MSGIEIHKREPENAMIDIAMHVVDVARTQGSSLVAARSGNPPTR
jgi:hypothetical protein